MMPTKTLIVAVLAHPIFPLFLTSKLNVYDYTIANKFITSPEWVRNNSTYWMN